MKITILFMLGLFVSLASSQIDQTSGPMTGESSILALRGDSDHSSPSNSAKGKKKKKSAADTPCSGEEFDATDRKAAKLSIGTGSVEDFDDLDALITSLPADDDMGKNHNPPISTDKSSKRVNEEERNVHVKKAWIYTYTREGDEDYHVILGTDPKISTKVFFDLEVSGLPSSTSHDRQAYEIARKQFTDHFVITGCIHDYTDALFASPVEVEVTGSLFFDKFHFDHKNQIGHGIAKPKLYWEIHPATDIQFK